MFTTTVWEFLVNKTNQYARHKTPKHTGRRSLYCNWRPVTIQEMKAFVGVILNMGIVQLQKVNDYWSTSFTCNIPFFRQTFSRDRFFQIFGMLHAGEINHQSKPQKIQPFLDLISPIIKTNYNLGRQIAVDESVITFKGRVSFRQYLKGKPNPWGIKAFVLADSNTGYMHNMLIYYGRDTALVDRPELSHTVKVVITLVEYLKNQGHDLYTDRFYTSPVLADNLDPLGITITGTVMANRRGLPKTLKKKDKVARGTIQSFRDGNKMALSWMDKRKILMLSTKYSNNTIDIPSR